jgi:hypothetical protein
MKIYIPPIDFSLYLNKQNQLVLNYFDTFHLYFIFCLFPLEIKKHIINCFNLESQPIFEKILQIDPQNYGIELSTLDDCKYVLYGEPIFSGIHSSNIGSTISRYLTLNKKVILFDGKDWNNMNYNYHRNIILFRTSGYKSKKSKNVFGCPTLNNDYFSGIFLDKKLSVGFCGTLHKNDPNFLRSDLFQSFKLRIDIIEELQKHSYFNFIEKMTWGDIENVYLNSLLEEKTILKKSKEEFIKSIEENLYTLCVRGAGNFSFRLGETFMMGRIPILINSDCILPFEDQIPYQKNTVYVTKENSDNFTNIHKVIQEFHSNHSEEELIQIQKENRQIWLDYFTVDGAFQKTLEIVKN